MTIPGTHYESFARFRAAFFPSKPLPVNYKKQYFNIIYRLE